MNLYFYEGPVKEFDRIVDKKWSGKTMAVSERQARNNLAYQFKVAYGRIPRTKISLPGEIIKIEMEDYGYDD